MESVKKDIHQMYTFGMLMITVTLCLAVWNRYDIMQSEEASKENRLNIDHNRERNMQDSMQIDSMMREVKETTNRLEELLNN